MMNEKYPYNEPLTVYEFGGSGFFDEAGRPAGDKEDGWIEWEKQAPPIGVLLYITYDFRNYPWICNAEELCPRYDADYQRGLWWRLTGIAKMQIKQQKPTA
jgi:hypothetical protein